MHQFPQFRTVNRRPEERTGKNKYQQFERVLPFNARETAIEFAKSHQVDFEEEISPGNWKRTKWENLQ